MKPRCCYQNILESSTVTLAAATEDPNYPLYRLYDRHIGLRFQPTAAVTTTVKVDQGAAPIAVSRLLIPDGHGLAGLTLDIKWSTDDLSYTPAVPQWAGAAGLINKEWSPLTKRYWQFIITAPASIPYFAELFLAPTYEWEKPPASPAGGFDDVFNVENIVTAGGGDRFVVYGDRRRQRMYKIERADETMKTSLLALNTAWAAAYPFWLSDMDGVWIYGKLRKALGLSKDKYNTYQGEFDFQEVLPE